jgi:signal transduction histidine kinase
MPINKNIQVLINLISNAIHYSNREEALIKIKTATNNTWQLYKYLITEWA